MKRSYYNDNTSDPISQVTVEYFPSKLQSDPLINIFVSFRPTVGLEPELAMHAMSRAFESDGEVYDALYQWSKLGERDAHIQIPHPQLGTLFDCLAKDNLCSEEFAKEVAALEPVPELVERYAIKNKRDTGPSGRY